MRFTEEYIKKWLLDNRDDVFIVGKYIDYNTKTDFYFSKCGHTPKVSFCGVKTNIKCGVCDGKQVDKSNSLKTFFPNFALEFHPEKNGDLTPDTVTKTSSKQIWWLCSVCRFEWDSRPCKRAIGQGGCPNCNEILQRTHKSAGTRYPYLKDICDLSEDIDICMIGPKSEKILSWTCNRCGDKTTESVVRKTSMPRCRKCLFDPRTGKEYVRLIDMHPEIADEYSSKNKIPVSKISIDSKARISWICLVCKGAYCGKIQQKANKTIKCSRCFPTILSPLSQTHPHLIAKWSPKNTLLPEYLSHGSEQKIWLVCEKEDCRKEYDTFVCIAAGGSGCPYCSGRRVTENTSLAYLQPDLARQWSNLNQKTPDEVTQFSHYKAWWNCSQCSNVWQAEVAKRSNGNGCPSCKASKGEAAIAKFLNSKNISFEPEKTFADCKNKNTLLFDFYLNDYDVCIEYDGHQHFMPIKGWGGEEKFEQTKENDQIKNQYCKNKGIPLLRIPYTDFDNIDSILSSFLVSRGIEL